jgi:predicted kinase
MSNMLKKRTYVFHGKSASGKSTLIRKLSSTLGLSQLQLDPFVLPLVSHQGNENVVGLRIREMFNQVTAHVAQIPYDLIETGVDFAESVLPCLFQAILYHQRIPVLVHFDISLDDVLRRNATRERPVPVKVLLFQNEVEGRGIFKQICRDMGVRILILGSEPIEEAVERVVSFMNRYAK